MTRTQATNASKSVVSHEEERPSLTPAESNPVTVAATTIKLPPFWPAANRPPLPELDHLWTEVVRLQSLVCQLDRDHHSHQPSLFTSDIRHILGSRNAAADALSRTHLETNALRNSSQPIDFSAIAAVQHNDRELRNWKSQPFPSLRLSAVPLPGTTTTVICDIAILEPLALLSQLPFDFWCIIPSTPCHTSVPVPLNSSSLRAWSGQGSTKMFRCGPEHVYSVSAPRCIDIPSHPYQPLTA